MALVLVVPVWLAATAAAFSISGPAGCRDMGSVGAGAGECEAAVQALIGAGATGIHWGGSGTWPYGGPCFCDLNSQGCHANTRTGWTPQKAWIRQVCAPATATATTTTPAPCTCSHGWPALGRDCPAPGAEWCRTCDGGYSFGSTQSFGVCTLPVMLCSDPLLTQRDAPEDCYHEVAELRGALSSKEYSETYTAVDMSDWEHCKTVGGELQVCTGVQLEKTLKYPPLVAEATATVSAETCGAFQSSADVCRSGSQGSESSRTVTQTLPAVQNHAMYLCFKGMNLQTRLGDRTRFYTGFRPGSMSTVTCARPLGSGLQGSGCPGRRCMTREEADYRNAAQGPEDGVDGRDYLNGAGARKLAAVIVPLLIAGMGAPFS